MNTNGEVNDAAKAAPAHRSWVHRAFHVWRTQYGFGNEVFAATFCFVASTVLRLLSSVILTRILYPEAYGLVTILWSVFFIVEMMSDLGVIGLMVRHEDGEKERFVNTLWTIKFVRACVAFGIVFFIAPWIAAAYDLPLLESAIRVFAFSFIVSAMESMSYVVMLRQSKARVQGYCELGASVLSTIFMIIYAYYSRDHWALIYGVLVQRAVMTVLSYRFLPEFRPRFQFDKKAAMALLGFAKFVMPSSMLTMVLMQYERIVLLKLFDLEKLGMYGLASNIASSVEGLVTRISRNVLYPRCTRYYREGGRDYARDAYYTQNLKLFAVVLSLPAALGGAAYLLINILYDSRYEYAGTILNALAIRCMLTAVTGPKENLLVAVGYTKVVLMTNVLRLCWLVPFGLLGWYLWGFDGFLYLSVLDLLPVFFYSSYLQYKGNLMIVRHELLHIAFMAGVFVAALVVCSGLLKILPHVFSWMR